MSSREGLRVGALGWEHPGWSGLFYPDDLPPEWRLGYYANEFNAVLVPVDRWSSAAPDEWQAWLDEVPDNFRFFLEQPPDGRGRTQLTACAAALAPQFARSLPLGGGVVRAAECADLRVVRERMEVAVSGVSAGTIPAMFLAGEPPDIGRLRELRLLAEIAGLA